jgi:hypothetical protein
MRTVFPKRECSNVNQWRAAANVPHGFAANFGNVKSNAALPGTTLLSAAQSGR